MAYYDIFIAAWNAQGKPAGTTGTLITGGMTKQQKVDAVNSWVFTGAVPGTIFVTGAQVANCIAWSEFAALTAQQQSNILALCNSPNGLLGGSANTAHILPGMIVAYFPGGGATITALSALSAAAVQPWWQANAYPRAFDFGDATQAGLS